MHVCILDFKSRILHTKISKALVQTSRWLINEQEHDGKWIDLHTTGNVLAVLKMIGHDMSDYNTCSNTFKKASDYFMANKFGIKQAYGGRLAYIIMGLNSLCKDPSNYHNMNLTDNLLKDVISFPKGTATYKHTHIHVCIYIYTHTCIYLYIYIYICIYFSRNFSI